MSCGLKYEFGLNFNKIDLVAFALVSVLLNDNKYRDFYVTFLSSEHLKADISAEN